MRGPLTHPWNYGCFCADPFSGLRFFRPAPSLTLAGTRLVSKISWDSVGLGLRSIGILFFDYFIYFIHFMIIYLFHSYARL